MNRADALARLTASPNDWDVLVIGGGATGLGTAVDAAARGYRTVLLEQSDFAKATSSRSTKLVHGGFRYLKQGNLSLVRESLRERGLLLQNAPHLVHTLSFVVPTYKWWESAFYGVGLKLYDLLAGRLSLGSTRIVSREKTLQLLPAAEPARLRGGVQYFDGQFDDARLALSLAQTLTDLGGVGVNYCLVVRLLKSNGRVCGVAVRDLESGREFELRTRVVVNATGVFTDDVRRMDEPAAQAMVTMSQGAHIVLGRSFLPGESALMVPSTDDGRVLFAIPWHNHVVVGTTDTLLAEHSLEPRPLDEEIEFLLEHAGRYLAKKPVAEDILSAFAGLRPLFKAAERQKTSKVSREHALIVSDSGLVTITGGKWTTYREMAEQAVDRAAKVAGLESRPSRSAHLALHGVTKDSPAETHLKVYGSDSAKVSELLQSNPSWGELLHPRLPYRAGEVIWAARFEMARTVEDVLARRMRILFLDARAAMDAAPKVAALMAEELHRDAAWQASQVSQFCELARGYLPTRVD